MKKLEPGDILIWNAGGIWQGKTYKFVDIDEDGFVSIATLDGRTSGYHYKIENFATTLYRKSKLGKILYSDETSKQRRKRNRRTRARDKEAQVDNKTSRKRIKKEQ